MPDRNMNTDPERNKIPRLGTDLPAAMDLLGIFSPVLQEAYGRSTDVDQETFAGKRTRLSPEEQFTLSSLRDEFAMLTQPIQQNQAIGGHIPGNEFSVSLQGLSRGMNDMATAIEGKRRSQRLFGDPERRQQIRATIDQTESQIGELRQNAENIRNGLIPANELAKLHPMADANEIAASVDEQAEALEQEISVYEEQLRQHSGVSSRLSEAEQQAEEVERNRTFRDEFINTFGADMYDRALKTMQGRENLNFQADLTRFREGAADRRQGMANRARIAAARSRPEADGLPNEVNTRFIGGILKNYSEGLQAEYEQFRSMYSDIDRRTGQATFNPELMPQEDLLLLQRYEDELDYLNEIEIARSFWDDPDFDKSQVPEFRHPSPAEHARLTAMRNMGIPRELVRAYQYYNFIDYNKQPLSPGEATSVEYDQNRPLIFFREPTIGRERRSQE